MADDEPDSDNAHDRRESDGTAASILIMEEARRLLVGLDDALNAVHTTAGTVLTGASIVAVVFGAVAASEHHRSHFSIGLEAVALVLFASTVFACVWMLAPRSWNADHDLTDWIAQLWTDGAPTALEVAANFADYFRGFHHDNLTILKSLQWWLAAACVLLGLQVVAWALVVI